MTSNTTIFRLGGIAVALMATACAPTTPQWDAQFGDSVRIAKQQQTLYPTAGGDAAVNGVEGMVARESIIRYRDSFKEPAPPSSAFTIGVSR